MNDTTAIQTGETRAQGPPTRSEVHEDAVNEILFIIESEKKKFYYSDSVSDYCDSLKAKIEALTGK